MKIVFYLETMPIVQLSISIAKIFEITLKSNTSH